MIHPTVDIHTYLKPGVRVHLAGIGGVSMCPLAEVLRGMGLTVQGSDMSRERYRTAPALTGHRRGHRPLGGES
mgnify:CR=1 FL=1